MLLDHATAEPDAVVVDDGTVTRTWSGYLDRVQRVAALLSDEFGLGPGDHAALLMHNRAEYLEIVLGAVLAGVWLTPVNWHLTGEEIDYILSDSGSRLVFTDEANRDLVGSTGPVPVLTAGVELDTALDTADSRPTDMDAPPGGTMSYTSGTTGRPKGVMRARPATVRETLDAQSAAGRRLGLTGRGPHLVTGPLYHAAPLLFALYDQANGAPLILMDRWDAANALRLLHERRIVTTHMVPTMFVRLLGLPDEDRAAFSPGDLELVLHGAAPVSAEVKERMIAWWGPLLVEYWGATEGGVVTLADSEEWLAHRGTVGQPLPRFEVFAVDDDETRLPPGSTGLLHCHHTELDEVFRYHNDPAKTAEAHPHPGTFTTGDVGWVDEDNWVFLHDRKSHMIVTGGVNVYPAEVERVIAAHRAVADVAVFGVPDDEWGEAVKAAVELSSGHEAGPETEQAILDAAREHLAAFKVPRSVDFEAQLPRTTAGKLYVGRLRERYWKGSDRRI